MSDALTTDELRSISPAPQRLRLSFLLSRTQVDVALPLDVPIVNLIPRLVNLAGAREAGQPDKSDDPSSAEAKNNVWVLSRHTDWAPLAPDSTLREAGVVEGELLRLTAKRALSPPTLYDDVVDAAARLNKAGYPAWDAAAARWMGFVGVFLASGVWVYFLLAKAFAPHRDALVGSAAAVAAILTGAAALANRRYARGDIAAALGWAVLPITAAVTWVALHGLGGYGLAAGCGVTVVVSETLLRSVGIGRWGYLAVEVISVLGGIALAVHAAGLRADLAGAGLALVATLGCLAVPRLTVRFSRATPLPREPGRNDDASTTPSPPTAEAHQTKAVTPTAAEDVWARVQAETLMRSALYVGLAVSAAIGALVVVSAPGPTHWSGLVFAWVCAAALGLHTERPVTAVERAGLAVPAAALAILSCAVAQNASQPIPIASFGVLLATTVVFAVAGASARPARPAERRQTMLAYLRYLTVAALIPLALWAVGAYRPWSFT
jgi:type VII secretion integral membrane protein EccD